MGTLTGLYRFERGRFLTIIPESWTSRIEEASSGNLLVITSKGFVEWDGKQIIRIRTCRPDWTWSSMGSFRLFKITQARFVRYDGGRGAGERWLD